MNELNTETIGALSLCILIIARQLFTTLTGRRGTGNEIYERLESIEKTLARLAAESSDLTAIHQDSDSKFSTVKVISILADVKICLTRIESEVKHRE